LFSGSGEHITIQECEIRSFAGFDVLACCFMARAALIV
jgi:hypothetical protein